MGEENEYCTCKKRSAIYSDLEMFGYRYRCSDCNKKLDDDFHYYNEPDDIY